MEKEKKPYLDNICAIVSHYITKTFNKDRKKNIFSDNVHTLVLKTLCFWVTTICDNEIHLRSK